MAPFILLLTQTAIVCIIIFTMTMHMMKVRAPTQKRKAAKVTKAQQAQWEADWHARNKWLKSIGLSKITLEQYINELHGRGTKTQTTKAGSTAPLGRNTPYIRETEHHPSVGSGVGCGLKAPTKVYTGNAMIGIGTMHKSNSVPIFSKDEAHDISTMRRG